MAGDVLAQRLELGGLREQGVVGGQQGVGGVERAPADRLVGVGAAVVAGRAARVWWCVSVQAVSAPAVRSSPRARKVRRLGGCMGVTPGRVREDGLPSLA